MRCHFVWSKIPITRSHASTISRLILTSSGLRSMRPRSALIPRAPKKPLPMLVLRRTPEAKSPTSDIAAYRRTPPGTITLTPGASARALATRRPFVTTTSSRLSRSSSAT